MILLHIIDLLIYQLNIYMLTDEFENLDDTIENRKLRSLAYGSIMLKLAWWRSQTLACHPWSR